MRIGRIRRLHGDERGTISIVTVFTLLMFTMLLVMIVNVGTHIDDKLKMQNAADAATYSGGVVLARGMNGLAFTNHLLSDVFAMTAFLREGRDRTAESLVPQVLGAWQTAGETLRNSSYPKFSRLGQAIVDTVPKEQEAVSAYGELTAAASDLSLPVFEHILQARLIGEFQRTLLRSLPEIAQSVTDEVARRHGLLGSSEQEGSSAAQATYEQKRGRQYGVLWRSHVRPVALDDESDPATRTVPVVDPDPYEEDYAQLLDGDSYLSLAVRQRRALAVNLLDQWNFDRLQLFNHDARMSTYFALWRMATCGQLEQLLNVEYPHTNLPMVLRHADTGRSMESLISAAEHYDPGRPLSRRRDDHYPEVMENLRAITDLNRYIEDSFHFVGIVYRRHRNELGPGVFQNPLTAQSDAQTYSQLSLFVPRPRKIKVHIGGGEDSNGGDSSVVNLGGTFGFTSQIEVPRERPPASPPPADDSLDQVLRERWVLENWPTHWDLLNQNWAVQLVPATARHLPEIMSSNPGGPVSDLRMPNLSDVPHNVFNRAQTH